MTSWLAIILVSYFILSISNLVDKIFLSNLVTDSIVYAVWVSLLSVGLVAVFVLHWSLDPSAYESLRGLGSLSLMTPQHIALAIGIGILFTGAIYLLYTALQRGEASRVIPLIGGSMPIMIFVLTLAYEPLSQKHLIAFLFLVIGTILISKMPSDKSTKKTRRGFYLAIGASFTFAVYIVLTQYLFRQHGFINGMIWPRLGSAVSLIFLLFVPGVRQKMKDSLSHLSTKMRAGWLSNQALGAIGFLGQQYVISIPGVSAALVSALQSVQYAFILIFASAVTLFKPKILREHLTPGIIATKIIAVICIAAGLYFIAG